jgi:fructose-1,6-bisphosphatase/inositol monophosphatase family enzyme
MTINDNDFKDFTKLLAIASGSVIKKYWRKQITINSKADESPVTIADKKAEEVMRELISKEFPEHGIIGEEFPPINETAEYKWILDPIDGTKSFICGTVTFGTLIALTRNDEPLLGVINQPILNEYLMAII